MVRTTKTQPETLDHLAQAAALVAPEPAPPTLEGLDLQDQAVDLAPLQPQAVDLLPVQAQPQLLATLPQSTVAPTPLTMALASVYATRASISKTESALQVSHARPMLPEMLMENVPAMMASVFTMESVLGALLVLSGAHLPTVVSTSVVRTVHTPLRLASVCVTLASVSLTRSARNAPQTTSSEKVSASPALFTPSTMLSISDANVLKASTPISLESAFRSVAPMKSTTETPNAASASLV